MPSTSYDDDPLPPPGVTLRDPEDTDALRTALNDGVLDGMKRYVDGFSYGGVTLRVRDLKYADADRYSQREQDQAKLGDRTLARRLRGTVELRDAATGDVLDTRKNMTLARVPWVTPRGTVIHGGSEYALISQSRLLPGSYARRRDNGELENHINVRPGTGSSMRVTLDPTTGQYRLKIGTSDLHAYSVFKDLGKSDEELSARWGEQVLAANRKGYSKDAVDRAYMKAVPRWERDPSLPREQKVAAILAALDKAQVAKSVLQSNLPHMFDKSRAQWLQGTGAALEKAAAASRFDDVFTPDLAPNDIADRWAVYDFGFQEAFGGADIIGKQKFAAADYRKLPDHWEDGWLEWYAGFTEGRRTDDDVRQMGKWAAYRREHGGRFLANPTPVRALALETWGMDPRAMLHYQDREAFDKAMRDHHSVEKTAWLVRSREFCDEDLARLSAAAKARGFESGSMMKAAYAGALRPYDFEL